MEWWLVLIIAAAALLLGALAGYFIRRSMVEKRIGRGEELAARLVDEAKNRAEILSKERIAEAKEEIHKLRSECDRECQGKT